MTSRVTSGQLVLRQWSRSGLVETSRPIGSLDELYAECLATGDPEMVDRIVIRGVDAEGHPHTLTFVFQSITVASGNY